MFYMFNQNNSGGYFIEDDKLCHRVVIEADSENDAMNKAESLGCYFNGVESGKDCECCGDRWYYPDAIDMERYKAEGYDTYDYAEKRKVKLVFNTVEEYLQYLANKFGWTSPDARVFYLDGSVSEVYMHTGREE